MKIKFLRQLYAGYKNTISVRRIFKGDHPEAINFFQLLSKLASLDENVLVPETELISLFHFVEGEPKLKFIKKLKQELNDSYLLPFFYLTQKVFNPNLLALYRQMELSQRHFCLSLLSEIELTELNLQKLMLLCQNDYFEEIIKFSKYDSAIKQILLRLCFAEESCNIKCIYYVAKYLAHYGLWLPEYVEAISNNSKPLSQVITKIHQYLTQSLIKKLLPSKNLDALINILESLELAENLNKKTVNFIITQQSFLNNYKVRVINFLQMNKTLDVSILHLIFKKPYNVLFNILPHLIAYNLQSGNIELIKDILEDKVDGYFFEIVIKFLQKHQLAKDEFLKSIIQKMKNNFTQPLLQLINQISLQDINIDEADFRTLLNFSLRNLERFTALIQRQDHRVLDSSFIKIAINRVNETLPIPTPTDFTKVSRKPSNLRSKLILNKDKTIYLEHDPDKKYFKGGMAKIKKGYATMTDTEPLYSIKILNQGVKDQKKLQRRIDEAQREVKYRRFLNQEAYYFQNNNKLYLISQWLKEKSLDHFNNTELQAISMEDRLKAYIYFLEELNQLHAHYRIHGDIKPPNLIYDSKQKILKIIDFGGAMKVGNPTPLAHTKLYRDGQEKKSSFADDMYAAGIILTFLFPEIYNVKRSIPLEISIKLLTREALAIDLIVNAMMDEIRDARCTSLECLTYCKGLLQNLHRLDEDFAENFAETVLDDPKNNVENALRGKYFS